MMRIVLPVLLGSLSKIQIQYFAESFIRVKPAFKINTKMKLPKGTVNHVLTLIQLLSQKVRNQITMTMKRTANHRMLEGVNHFNAQCLKMGAIILLVKIVQLDNMEVPMA